eukprot:snap_masked-scaffold_28-processed-gene-3.51-mRNA-1 protein AED:1.00 eAED:1.00 QI:0/0/0/0/1/1/3/0/66
MIFVRIFMCHQTTIFFIVNSFYSYCIRSHIIISRPVNTRDLVPFDSFFIPEVAASVLVKREQKSGF